MIFGNVNCRLNSRSVVARHQLIRNNVVCALEQVVYLRVHSKMFSISYEDTMILRMHINLVSIYMDVKPICRNDTCGTFL